MPFTEADYLPSEEELKVTELNMTAAPLRAAAHQMGKYCDEQSKEFMLCRREEKDPRKCVYEGKEVTRCGVEFLQKMKKSCAKEFTDYWKCVDHSAMDMRLHWCRGKQALFDRCVFDTIGQERPPPGHFSRIRIHESKRPEPQRVIPMPDPVPEPIDPTSVPVPESVSTGTRNSAFEWTSGTRE